MDSDLELSVAELRARRGSKWHRYPPDVLPAWIADMDFPVAPPVQRAIERIAEQGDYAYALREPDETVAAAFKNRMRERFAWEPDPDLVIEVADLIQAVTAGIVAFAAPGEGVVVQTPIYPPFLSAIDEAGRRRVENPLRDDGTRFSLDLESLRAAVDETTRILLVCNPHNPSGRVLTKEELLALGRLAVERDLTVICDEIHADLLFDGARHLPMATLGADLASRTITITSATKGFNVPALRCGVMHFGAQPLLDRFRATLPPKLLGRPSHAGADATVAAWREGQPWLDRVLRVLALNRERLGRWVDGQPGVRWYPPQSTYLAWLDFAELHLQPSPQEFLLHRAKVGLNPGSDFGAPGTSCARLNFATSPTILEQVLERMSGALSSSEVAGG